MEDRITRHAVAHFFSSPVRRSDEDEYNPAAHGCVCYLETREDGRTRRVNVNGSHEEIGPWR